MKLWLLKKTSEGENQSPEYDVQDGCVVAADCPSAARKCAAKESGDEGPEFWMNIYNVICIMIAKEVHPQIKPGMILRSFNAG